MLVNLGASWCLVIEIRRWVSRVMFPPGWLTHIKWLLLGTNKGATHGFPADSPVFCKLYTVRKSQEPSADGCEKVAAIGTSVLWTRESLRSERLEGRSEPSAMSQSRR